VRRCFFPRISQYGHGDVTAEMLTASLQAIGNAAKKIISLIENSGELIEEGEGEQSPAPLAIPA
jgi:hypothetical protein